MGPSAGPSNQPTRILGRGYPAGMASPIPWGPTSRTSAFTDVKPRAGPSPRLSPPGSAAPRGSRAWRSWALAARPGPAAASSVARAEIGYLPGAGSGAWVWCDEGRVAQRHGQKQQQDAQGDLVGHGVHPDHEPHHEDDQQELRAAQEGTRAGWMSWFRRCRPRAGSLAHHLGIGPGESLPSTWADRLVPHGPGGNPEAPRGNVLERLGDVVGAGCIPVDRQTEPVHAKSYAAAGRFEKGAAATPLTSSGRSAERQRSRQPPTPRERPFHRPVWRWKRRS